MASTIWPACEPFARGFAPPSVRKLAHCSIVRTLWILEAAEGVQVQVYLDIYFRLWTVQGMRNTEHRIVHSMMK